MEPPMDADGRRWAGRFELPRAWQHWRTQLTHLFARKNATTDNSPWPLQKGDGTADGRRWTPMGGDDLNCLVPGNIGELN
jgi:hypothetical protein